MSYVAPSDGANKPHVAGYLLPIALRNFVRSRETGLVVVAIVIGLFSGLLVATISKLSDIAHALLFDIPFDAHLSATGVISWQRTLLVPTLGGVLLAMIGVLAAGRLKGQQLADAIEANALYGGRVSFRGSLLISIQTLLSNGFGGSVGLEAGYTQICSMFGSHVGQRLAARRNDMRLLVACGAAGAISAAFSAPLAGAFYAFEVVLGAYTAAGLVPVIASAVGAWLVARHLSHPSFLMVPGFPSPVSVEMIGQTVLIGIICAFASIDRDARGGVFRALLSAIVAFQRLPSADRGGALLGVAGAAYADRAGRRSWRDADPARQQSDLAAADHDHPVQDAGVGDLARIRLSRRIVLCLPAARRADRRTLQHCPERAVSRHSRFSRERRRLRPLLRSAPACSARPSAWSVWRWRSPAISRSRWARWSPLRFAR